MVLCSFVSGDFVDDMRLLGFSHFAVGGCRGTLGSSSCFRPHAPLSSLSSLLPLMLPPSPSSESVKSRDTSATSPSRVFALVVVFLVYGRISGSNAEFWFGYG